MADEMDEKPSGQLNDGESVQKVIDEAPQEVASKTPKTDNDGSSNENGEELVHEAPFVEESKGPSSETNVSAQNGASNKNRNKKPLLIAAVIACLILLSLPMVFPQLFCKHESWREATCDAPRTCEQCGKTEGDPLGHDWSEATCTTPKTCSRCGATDGEALGHDLGEWKHVVDYINASSEDVQKCKRCGKTVDTKNKADMTSFVGDGKFTISAADYCERLEDAFATVTDSSSIKVGIEKSSDGETTGLKITHGSKTIAYGLFFSDSSTSLAQSMTRSEDAVQNIVIYFESGTGSTYIAASIISTVEACDPSLSSTEARSVATDCLDGQVEKNGITYTMTKSDGWWLGARIS